MMFARFFWEAWGRQRTDWGAAAPLIHVATCLDNIEKN